MACNTDFHNPISSTVISVPAGAKLGALWGHVLGGAQFANDQDNPIARSHKGKTRIPFPGFFLYRSYGSNPFVGPIQAYLYV